MSDTERKHGSIGTHIIRWLVGPLLGFLAALVLLPLLNWVRVDLAAGGAEWSSFCLQGWPALSNEVTGGMLPSNPRLADAEVDDALEYLVTTAPAQFPGPAREYLVELQDQAKSGGLTALQRGADSSRYAWKRVYDEYDGDICTHRRTDAI